ncbi:MAG: hypothetical protein ACT4PW_04335 [Acidimicrobiia bacterium]
MTTSQYVVLAPPEPGPIGDEVPLGPPSPLSPGPGPAPGIATRRGRVVEAVARHPYLFVAAVVLALQVPYAVLGPNLLADDWVWLRNAHFGSWTEAGGFRQHGRPGAFVLYAVTFGLVGPHPLALYAVQSALLVGAALAVLALFRTVLPPRVALAAAGLWAVAPQHTSLAFWASTSQVLACLMLAAVGLRLAIRSIRAGGIGLAGTALMAASITFYEITAGIALAAAVALPVLLRRPTTWAATALRAALVAAPVAWSLALDTVYPEGLVQHGGDLSTGLVTGNLTLGLAPFGRVGTVLGWSAVALSALVLVQGRRRRRWELSHQLIAYGYGVIVLGLLPLYRVWSELYGFNDRMTAVSGFGGVLVLTGLLVAARPHLGARRAADLPWVLALVALALLPVQVRRARVYDAAGREALSTLERIEGRYDGASYVTVYGRLAEVDRVNGLNDGWNATAAVQLRGDDPTRLVEVIADCFRIGPPRDRPLAVFGEVPFGSRFEDCYARSIRE